MNTCNICGRTFEYSRKKGGTKNCCNSCSVNKRRVGLKNKCLQYLGGKCSVCHYNKCERALEFHHLDASKKEFQISGAHSRSWSSLEKELDKCILLCANCHRELHSNPGDSPSRLIHDRH